MKICTLILLCLQLCSCGRHALNDVHRRLQAKNGVDLGEFHLGINVKDLQASVDFYVNLGFTILGDHSDEGYCRVGHNNLILDLYQGHLGSPVLINYRGGDVREIYDLASSRGLKFIQKPTFVKESDCWTAGILDPNGFFIYFCTYPNERENWLKRGRTYSVGGSVSEELQPSK